MDETTALARKIVHEQAVVSSWQGVNKALKSPLCTLPVRDNAPPLYPCAVVGISSADFHGLGAKADQMINDGWLE